MHRARIAASSGAVPAPPGVHPKGMPGLEARAVRALTAQGTAAPVRYQYVYGAQRGVAAGATVRLFQAQPAVAPADYHSLAELAIESADGRQIVEVGWTVDPGLYADPLPHLFVFHWVDGEPAYYDSGRVRRTSFRFGGSGAC